MDGGGTTRSDAALAVIAEESSAITSLAAAIDREGMYPVDQLRRLGAAGAFGLHLSTHSRVGRPSLADAIEAMALVSAECMSTGFCVWCQDAAAWYLEHTDNVALRDRLHPAIVAGHIMAGTGLSNPVKALSGSEDFCLRGKRVPGGYIVSGILPWVSNLGEGHWFGTIFEDADDAEHRVMAMVQVGQEGVRIKRSAIFIALEGTGTYSLLFRRAFIADEQLLADPLGDMVERIRPGFVLLQTGMGLGVIDAAAALMRQADQQQGHCNTHLEVRAGDVAEKSAQLRERIRRIAATPHERSRAYAIEYVQVRLDVSEFCLKAVQSAMLHWGARGYLEGSAVHRRMREAWFVAIITPSIRHLRREIALLSQS